MAVTSARDKAGDDEALGPVRLLGQVDVVFAHDVGGHLLDGRSRNVLRKLLFELFTRRNAAKIAA
tara:strand:- start:448 stop:642 length:195 start_codon:yes stop_codon:yes gene_type:complete